MKLLFNKKWQKFEYNPAQKIQKLNRVPDCNTDFTVVILQQCKTKIIETTVGRVLFNEVVPKSAGYFNEVLTKKALREIIGKILRYTSVPETSEFLDTVMSHITFPGSIYLAAIAVFPALVVKLIGMQQGWALFYGGTSLLIMVGVAIDTIQQVNSYLLNRHYDGLMSKTTRNRRAGTI